jgi:hypothetical protein
VSSAPQLRPVDAAKSSRWRALVYELPGIMGLGLVCAGVYLLAGLAWTFIAAGTPLLLSYVAREARFVRRWRGKP